MCQGSDVPGDRAHTPTSATSQWWGDLRESPTASQNPQAPAGNSGEKHFLSVPPMAVVLAVEISYRAGKKSGVGEWDLYNPQSL